MVEATPMQKKILVAVDRSPQSRAAVDYAARMHALIPELGFTLFHVHPPISQFLLDEAKRDAQARVELKKIVARNAEASDGLLAGLKEAMLRTGVAEGSVEIMAQARHQGVAKDILDVAQSSLYDAILIGRRGIGGLQKLFMGSVSAHLIENSALIPVWMVDGKVFSTRVMAAVDGSESALRAVDHLAFILSGVPEARVCFFHVTPRLQDFCE
ncbi:MAG: universal stress protein, partial [Desulfobacteraceae bacterium]